MRRTSSSWATFGACNNTSSWVHIFRLKVTTAEALLRVHCVALLTLCSVAAVAE